MVLSRKKHFKNKVVFVDGLPGCGKTLFSSLISSLDKVELLSYVYEIEEICSLLFLKKISKDTAKALIQKNIDLKIYNTSMGRDVNCRNEDLSSIHNYHNPKVYLERFSGPGDLEIIDIINQNQSIFNFSTHNILSYSWPIWNALKLRAFFLNIVRHPVYMIRQQSLNWDNLINNVRNFDVTFNFEGHDLPYYIKDWEERFLKANSIEKSIFFIELQNIKLELFKEKLPKKFEKNILTISFEKFVLDHDLIINRICDLIDTRITSATASELIKQNIPRSRVNLSLERDIYKRCGWKAPDVSLPERELLDAYTIDILKGCSEESARTLKKLSLDYEKEFWSPD